MTPPDALHSTLARSNVNSWWGAVTAELLWRFGVKTVVISPGSRSTPLTFACAAHGELETPVILDERSAGFFALGLAKARHEAVALVCTSGTAVANYLPVVIEASESGTPLLVLSADRPPELRYRHAGQTIDQIKLFGDAVRFFAEAMVPTPRMEVLHGWRDLLAQAIGRASAPFAGPVHVNCPLRDPLAPGAGIDPDLPKIPDNFWACARPRPRATVRLSLPEDLPPIGWIIAGPASPADPERYVKAVGKLASKLGWPVLADALSPCRHFPLKGVEVVTAYDTFLRNPAAREAVRPEGVLQLGELPTSKVLRQTVAAWQLPTWIVDPAPDSRNATAVPAVSLVCRVEELEVGSTSSVAEIPTTLMEHEKRARRDLESVLCEEGTLREPAIARALIEATPAGTPIFIASSMPVRDAEYFWPANSGGRRIYFNRGANGIDGTLSTALGMAEAARKPSILYTGELALLHDTNGLLVANSAFTGSLTIVCVNNGGGGIFEHLPIAEHRDIFERYFATPQKVDFAKWAEAYGIEHRLIASVNALNDALCDLPTSGVRLLEMRTDRKRDAKWRRETFARIAASDLALP